MSNLPVSNPLTNLTMTDLFSFSARYGGLAKSCRFAVKIMPSRLLLKRYGSFMHNFTYLCETAEMPGRGFMSLDVRYYGPNQKLPFQTSYEDITLTFLCRSESYERQFFDDWMESINPTNTYDFNFRSDYETTIDIIQLAEYSAASSMGPNQSGADRRPKETYKITLFNAYPTLVNPQPMTWADDQVQRLAITFTYHKWRRVNYDPKITNEPNLIKGRPSAYRNTTPNRE